LESEISLAALIEVSRTQTTLNGSCWINYVFKSVKVSSFSQKHRAANLPTWQMMAVLPRKKVLNALTALTDSCCFT